ncbi:MAG: 50S ribosomal protein L29 [Candidatus Aenigmarchaeota archaeon]|nr:50S ribosomal protein L29 [Candidatus Aenigmarchaeota archaeon]
MAILRIKEIRKSEEKDLNKKMEELKLELSKERANINIGAPVTSPGRVREIRKTIARILTVKNQRNQQPKTVSEKVKATADKTKQPKLKANVESLKGGGRK